MRYSTSDPLEYELMDGLGMGVAVENMIRNPVSKSPAMGYFDPVTGEEYAGPPAPAAAAAPADETPWYAKPVQWVMDVFGNVNYIDENVRVSTTGGVLTVDRSGQPAGAAAPTAPTIIQVPSALQNIPTVAWVGGAAILALLLIRK